MYLTKRGFLYGAASLAATAGRARAQASPVVLDARPFERAVAGLPRPLAALAFNNAIPGPSLRTRPGAEVWVELRNWLSAPLALHWQGVRIANPMDGAVGLTQPRPDGAPLAYRFVPPDPGFFWYRPSALPAAADQLERGLCGTLIVEEAAPPPVDQEIVAEFGDLRLTPDGALAAGADAATIRGAGRIGRVVTVNGMVAPQQLAVRPGARLRLRLVNVAPARLFVVAFLGVKPMILAIDGQPCDPFEPVRQTIPVGPGARFDLILDMPATAGEALVVARGPEPPGGTALPDQPLLLLRAEGEPLPGRGPVPSLPLNAALPPAIRLQNATRMDLVIEGGAALPAGMGQALAMGYLPAADPKAKAPPPWRLNGRAGEALPDKPLFSVKRGSPVTLGFVNKTSFPQTMHVHGHVMRLLHPLDDGWEPYWRDAVIVPDGKTSRIAFLADNPGRWLICSTNLDRAANGLAAWFEVT